ncbi:MAG TPA: cell shape determination protein CcmA [Flavobacteriales bacterium]|nr:cell shape determination protein CcmA [Flavobacteriales bacterium]
MFKKSNNMARNVEVESGMRNHLAAGTSVKGDIITEGDIRIDGKVDGSVVSKGKLVIGQTGEVAGDIRCANATISGNAEGQITVSDMLDVQKTGKVNGEIVYGKLSVDPGAEIIGKVSIAGKVKDISASGTSGSQREEKSA